MCAYQTRHRQKRAARARMFKSVFFMILLGISAVIGFRFGARDVIANEASLKETIRTLKTTTTDLQNQLGSLETQKKSLEQELATARADYQHDVPVGPAKELSVLVQKRLDEQVPADRLREVIARIPSDKSCKSAQIKRFQPATGDSLTSSASITFEDGSIRINGKGVKAKDENGSAQSWFDPAQEVIVVITNSEGKETTLQGLLPLEHQWVENNAEFHLEFVNGPRSFVQAKIERCKFP